jgi:hypothetical protein
MEDVGIEVKEYLMSFILLNHKEKPYMAEDHYKECYDETEECENGY